MDNDFETPPWSLGQEESRDVDAISDIITPNVQCLRHWSLANYIAENLQSADLKWSLFCAACNSYRYDSVLKPFPPFFLQQDDKKEIDRLREIIDSCPPMVLLITQLRENSVPAVLFDLLKWVLIHQKEPYFRLIDKTKHEGILSQTSSAIPVAMPDYIFSVTYGSAHQQKFAMTALNRSTNFAFHGSRLDNFYSIVNNGLQVSYNKIAAFGPGIYLSREMGISLPYSPRGFTWRSSLFGSHISVVALCEVIDHPEVRSEKNPKKTKFFEIGVSKTVPGKYIIVENNDLVRIRYLLVYCSEELETATLMESSTLLGWIKRHKMFTMILAYVILLLGVGCSNSSFFYKYYRRLMQFFLNYKNQP